MAEMSMKLGRLVATKSVRDKMSTNREFYNFVWKSLERYVRMDWGDITKEDKQQNDEAVLYGERILAVYKHDDSDEGTIWIITEWDRSVTTVLFPDEY